ncbi:Dihydrolipoyllysine-residue acetyltransferase component of pyruvate dehydrogenase complex [Buchnera aphidicola (Cinara piceae)]|uniref:Dihydrolipoamide acetyltransferase component of pyruvate dehydrogenase complex n=1 Tax=Buchnera aphidicola (Cinara piceae) TaxID=1660043 RepID=A0A803FTM8_9GAMM|nr:2-oxo acid dehydrogenase subunit E2 [Buchnera aphidicola]VFP88146.1 Dihydrolipoyllysine-residue acetyltransferase component of pyruvate dehydrogenase complex [Buchnera aphidicola (Cinara piceae)]
MDIEVCVPDIGVDVVEVVEILVKKGEKVEKESSLISVEGHKSVLEIPSPISGIIKKICVKVGDKLSINQLIVILDSVSKNKCTKKNNVNNVTIDNIDTFNALNSNEVLDSKNDNKQFIKQIYASPNVRRFARKLNIKLSNIKGSGRKGRIIREDVYKYNLLNNNTIYNDNSINKKTIKNLDDKNEYKLLTPIQRVSGNNLLNNWKNIPHVTQFDEADITDLENFRKLYNSRISKNEIYRKISLLSFLVKSVVYTLIKYPRLNSVLDASKKSILLKKDINIGIAVDTKDGLLVPVLKHLQYKNICEISIDINNIVKKAKNNQLKISEMSGGSFTISSLGGIGGTGFTPIINSPEVGILGISKAVLKPVWNQKKFYPRLILPFSLSYDHRVIDGADGVRFTTFLSYVLSDIRNLLI